jgi:putative transposase
LINNKPWSKNPELRIPAYVEEKTLHLRTTYHLGGLRSSPIIKQRKACISGKDLARERGIIQATFYNWKAKYSCMDANQVRPMKDLEEENTRSNPIVANRPLEIDAIKHVLEKSSAA